MWKYEGWHLVSQQSLGSITALLKKEGEAQTINKASLNVEYRDNSNFVVGSSDT